MRRHPFLAAFLLLVLTALPSFAEAKTGKEIKEMEKAARKACMVGNYQEGVGILVDLFIDVGDSNYIYNQARCFQQNHRWEEAVDKFREYLRKAAKLTAAERGDIEDHIKECESHQTKVPPAVAAPAPTPPPVPQPVAPVAVPLPPPPAPAPTPVLPPAAPARDVDRGQGLRTAGIVTGVLGLAGLGLGVFCSVKTHNVANDDELNSFKTLGIVSYAAGGAALVTGLTLYLAGWSMEGDSDGPAVSLAPVLGPSHGSLVLSGRF
jgi:hypothetical protein